VVGGQGYDFIAMAVEEWIGGHDEHPDVLAARCCKGSLEVVRTGNLKE